MRSITLHHDSVFLLCRRIVTVILVVISVVWIPILQSANSGQLYVYIQSVTSYLAPPVTAIFVMAVFWKRTNEAVRMLSSTHTHNVQESPGAQDAMFICISTALV